MKLAYSIATLTLAVGVLGGFASSAMAADHDTNWQKNHPRREQVNQRLANQNRRINQEYREGELTRVRAQQLHREDGRILQEERDMSAMNGGYITRPEQRVLNQQENMVGRQIGW